MADERSDPGPVIPRPPEWRRYAGMGTEFAGALCGLTLVGYWIDRHYGTGNKGVLICGGIGLIGGMYNFIRQALNLSKESEREAHHRHDATHQHDRNETDHVERP